MCIRDCLLKVECLGHRCQSSTNCAVSHFNSLKTARSTASNDIALYFAAHTFCVGPPTELNRFFPQRKQIKSRSKVIRIQNANTITPLDDPCAESSRNIFIDVRRRIRFCKSFSRSGDASNCEEVHPYGPTRADTQ